MVGGVQSKIGNNMLRAVKRRWHSPSGYKEVLVLAIPLVITTSSGSLQSFIDRMFLSWFDSNALAATVPAAMICFTLTALFVGTASYVGVFVAQYFGAREEQKIGASVWQGFYIIGLSLLVVIPVFIFAEPLFRWIGHDPILQAMEASYSQILILSIPLMIVSGSLSGFFSGISRTSVVMWSNLLITVLNLLLDYGLIFGNWGLPRMGVAGAAWATVISVAVGTAVQLWIFLKPEYRQRFKTHHVLTREPRPLALRAVCKTRGVSPSRPTDPNNSLDRQNSDTRLPQGPSARGRPCRRDCSS